jgi:adenine-specific DNA-methyltransferase
MATTATQPAYIIQPYTSSRFSSPGFASFPRLRFMGSKYKLLPWIQDVLSEYRFNSVLDAFSGSGCVSYLFKTMGKRVVSNDFLNFCANITKATVENDYQRFNLKTINALLTYSPFHKQFIEKTFKDIFFTTEDLRFLDVVSWNIRKQSSPYIRALAIAALVRSCVKRQPRGVFTVAGDPERYKDGRRDLRLSLKEHFLEQIEVYNRCVFSNHKTHYSVKGNIFDFPMKGMDLVYMDPPYVPRADDNCYVKRYHFLEGLSCYWNGLKIMEESRVKKIAKPYTPFSYRKEALNAFHGLFSKFSDSILVLSYSSNGFPDLDILVSVMKQYKKNVKVYERNHRYHFGTHANAERNEVQEYLIVGNK